MPRSSLYKADTLDGLADYILSRCVRVPSGCLEWRYANCGGYGVIGCTPVLGPRKLGRCARIVYIARAGPIPDDWDVDHRECDNPPCCEFEHLLAVPHRDNILRSAAPTAINARKTCCPRCGGPYRLQSNGDRTGRFCPACKEDGRKRRLELQRA